MIDVVPSAAQSIATVLPFPINIALCWGVQALSKQSFKNNFCEHSGITRADVGCGIHTVYILNILGVVKPVIALAKSTAMLQPHEGSKEGVSTHYC